jgi:CubicO group peptidase (beta-lactamase class C family)
LAGTGDVTRCGPAWELVRARGAAAQLCVLRDGEVVLDQATGCRPDDLFWIFSASKPYVAMLVHLLAERGELSLDDPVTQHWPEFGRYGKQAITIRHVLRHRAGVPVARGVVADGWTMTDWDRSVRHIERATPRWPAGQVPAYHIVSYGFILGELLRRVSGVPVEALLRSELLDPLGLADTHLGLPASLWRRHVPIRAQGAAAVAGRVLFNRRRTREAVIPAAGVSTTARDLARFYDMLLRGGELDGVRVVRPETVTEARRPSSDGEVDRFIRLPIRWAQGFQLGGPGAERGWRRPLGQRSSSLAFGHNGSNCCIGWADPTRGIAFAYLTNLLVPGHAGARHLSDVADAVLGST